MPEYNTRVTYDIQKGGIYEIQTAEGITTRMNLSGVRVSLRSRDGKDQREYAVTLWPAEQVSATSKWGSFVSVLGNNTDSWVNKWIRVDEWQSRLCMIALVSAAPKPAKYV